MLLINIADVIANAFIQVMETTPSKRFLSYAETKQYGINVVRFLHDKGKPAILMCSRDDVTIMLHDYEEFFEEHTEEDGTPGIKLRDGKTVKDLIHTFRGYLGLSVLFAFLDEDVAKVLKNPVCC